jgi:hypothetical protein
MHQHLSFAALSNGLFPIAELSSLPIVFGEKITRVDVTKMPL